MFGFGRWMALRMLRYVMRQIELWRLEHPESTLFPLIIPLIMYHEPDRAWTAPHRVEDLFVPPPVARVDEPDPELVPRYDQEYPRWRRLYSTLKE